MCYILSYCIKNNVLFLLAKPLPLVTKRQVVYCQKCRSGKVQYNFYPSINILLMLSLLVSYITVDLTKPFNILIHVVL